jgi:hypothetical protein
MKTAISLKFRVLSIEFKSELFVFLWESGSIYNLNDGLIAGAGVPPGVSVYHVDRLGYVFVLVRTEMVARKTTQQPGLQSW